MTYTQCTTIGDTGNNEDPWCPTSVDSNGVYVKGGGAYARCDQVCKEDPSITGIFPDISSSTISIMD